MDKHTDRKFVDGLIGFFKEVERDRMKLSIRLTGKEGEPVDIEVHESTLGNDWTEDDD